MKITFLTSRGIQRIPPLIKSCEPATQSTCDHVSRTRPIRHWNIQLRRCRQQQRGYVSR